MTRVAADDTKWTRATWSFVIVGMTVGVALGVLVSITTDLPLAPEAGLLLGAVVGWALRRASTSRTP
jgi:hypothetical protein